ncbi:MAG: hypothetical protein M0Z55_01450 [Peptococcaceae bacterium]|nr:hypothetical protein [Peptococcaceae bacterium]
MQVKIFASDKPEKLEKTLNQWLDANSWLQIKQITQSAGSQICISIWYEEPNVPILG